MERIIYREFRQGDMESVLQLFSAAFGKPADEASWKWKYFSNPDRSIVIVAEIEGKIVGHYGVLPRRIMLSDGAVSGGLVIDGMTHPDFGRRGIFVNCAISAFEECKRKGIQVVLAFPNEAAVPGHRKVGWSELGSLKILVKPLTARPFLVLFTASSIPKWISFLADAFLKILCVVVAADEKGHVVETTTADEFLGMGEPVEDLLREAAPSRSVGVARDLNWLRWRLSEPGSGNCVVFVRDQPGGAIRGAAAVKVKQYRGMKTGSVLSLLIRDGDEIILRQVLRGALRKMISQGCDLALMIESPAFRNSKPARGLMFLRAPRKLRYIARQVDGSPLPEEMRSLGNWHIELIDHDVI